MDSTRHLRMLLRHSIAKGMSSWKDVQITKSLQSQQVEKKKTTNNSESGFSGVAAVLLLSLSLSLWSQQSTTVERIGEGSVSLCVVTSFWS